MYSIKDVSEMLGVSKTTVYNHLKKQNKELKGNIFKNKAVTFINDEGITILKHSLGLIQVPTIQEENVGIEQVIETIKNGIVEEIKEDNKRQRQSYEMKFFRLEQELKQEIMDLKNQNEMLIEVMKELIKK